MMERNYRNFKAEQQAYKDLHPNIREKVVRMTQNFEVINGTAVNKETGEIITDKLDIQPVITQEQRRGKSAQENLANHQTENGGFFFAYYEACKSMGERFPYLTQSDLARLMFIGTYLSWETNHLVYDNGRPINKKALGELLGMSRNKYGTFYKTLTQNGIISEADTGLVMDPTVFYRGSDKKASADAKKMQYTRLFRKTIRELYAMFNGRSIKKLGIIYAVLPYVNFNYNIICKNPSEVQHDKVEPMSVSELAKELGYSDHRKLLSGLRDVKYKEESLFGFFEYSGDPRKKRIVVNPFIVYAGNGKHLDAIKILFK